MPGFQVEYAKSGRSTCKGCNKLIEQGSLRIGKLVPSPHFDGEMPLWHHRACMFKREVILDATLLKGLENIRPDDQKSLKDEVKKNNGGSSSSSSLPAAAAAVPMIMDAAGDKFCADYAKSNRSTCKHCATPISKDELRVAKMVKSPSFDGLVPAWHHLKCVFKACIILSHGLIDGLDALRPEDQAELKALVTKMSPMVAASSTTKDADGDETMDATTKKKKTAGKKRRKGDDSDDEEEEDEPSKKAKTTPAADYSKMTFDELKKHCKELGLPMKGKKADLIERLEEAANSSPASSSAPVVLTPEEAEKLKHEQAIEEEGKKRWEVKDAISRVSKAEVKQLLAENSQPIAGGPDILIDRLVDGLMYGRLPPCPECGQYAFVFKDGEYACHGQASEWARCIYKAGDVKRTKFTIATYDGDCEYLTNYKWKANKKPVESHAFMANLTKKVSEQHQQLALEAEAMLQKRREELVKENIKEELFDGFTFVFVGSKFPDGVTAKSLKSLVESHGGETSTDIDDADLIITTPEEIAANKNKKLKAAQGEKKPILKASFITDSIEKVELCEPKDYSLVDVDLDELKTKVESGRQKSGAKLESVKNNNDKSSSSSSTKSGMGKSGSGKAKVTIKGRGAVDEDSGLAETGHILEEKEVVWTATMSITDLTSGVNSYYILQLIEGDTSGQYHVFRKWGRTGSDRGSHKLSEHGRSKDSAKSEFREVFYEKTGNGWDTVAAQKGNFVKKPGKFNLIDVDYSGGDDLFDEADQDSDKNASLLDPRIQDIIKIFFDVKAIKKTLASMEIDMDKMPLGKLSRSHIQSGYSVLTEIQDAIKSGASDATFLGLSNKFFTIIPHAEGGAAILKTEEQVKEKLEMVETLLEIEVATRLLKESKDAQKNRNDSDKEATKTIANSNDPIDIHYRQLKTDMKVIEKDTKEFKLIDDYIKNTHAPTHKNYTLDLLEAFDVDREKEGDRYKTFEDNPNRMLLWHGSRTSNFVGILSQGLRIAPPEAPVTGYMFGKGVYFADMVSKSANYTFTNSQNNIGFLLLCEVALGDMNQLTRAQYMDKAPGKCLSTKGVGLTCPDPSGNVVLENGCVVPSGKPMKISGSSSLLYNEFIVYDVAQIRMKHLLKVRFNYQQRW